VGAKLSDRSLDTFIVSVWQVRPPLVADEAAAPEI